MICPNCGNEYDENWASSCPYCQPRGVQRAAPVPVGYVEPVVKKPTDPMAVISLVAGLCFFFGLVVSALVAIIFGFISRKRIKESRGTLQGISLANWGIGLGFLQAAVIVALLGFLVYSITIVPVNEKKLASSLMVIPSNEVYIVLNGTKTQFLSVDDRYSVGTTVSLKNGDSDANTIGTARIMSSQPVKIGDLTTADVQEEGFTSMAQLQQSWENRTVYPWNPNRTVWVVDFQLVK